MEALASGEGDHSYQNILTWLWKYADDKRLVVVNYSDEIAYCRIKLDLKDYPEQFEITDVLNEKTYIRSAAEAYHDGLFIRLDPFQSHIFIF